MRSAGLKIDMPSGLTGKRIAYAYAVVGDQSCMLLTTYAQKITRYTSYGDCHDPSAEEEPKRRVQELDLHQDVVLSRFRFDRNPSREASFGGSWGRSRNRAARRQGANTRMFLMRFGDIRAFIPPCS